MPQTCAFNAIPTTTAPAYYEAMHREDYSLQDKISDPIAFLAQSDGDTLHYGQAMKADDKENFKQAMNQEFMDHCERKNWKILPIEAVPKGEKVLDTVWAMHLKKKIDKGNIQMESKVKFARRPTGIWCELLRHLLTCRELVQHPFAPNPLFNISTAHKADRFRHGIPPKRRSNNQYK